MKLTWLTDTHLNFLEANARKLFYQDIINSNADGILLSGDIAEAPSVVDLLKEMANTIQKPIYFVLGNHDYYRGKVNEVRAEMLELSKTNPFLRWLPVCEAVLLNHETALVGSDGWADGRYGDFHNSRIVLNDSRMIVDLFQQKIVGKHLLLEKMQQLADADAKQLKENLKQAINQYHPKKVIVLTHVPPFKEACMHEGEMSNEEWLPYFASKASGDVLIKVASKNLRIEFIVLCGHTHSPVHYKPLDNLTIRAGGAEYYRPGVQEVIEIN